MHNRLRKRAASYSVVVTEDCTMPPVLQTADLVNQAADLDAAV
jgi:hypothetical protein